MTNRIAPKGEIFVCGACGKRSRDRYGEQAIDYGWDELCTMCAVLCYADQRPNEDGVLTWEAVPAAALEQAERIDASLNYNEQLMHGATDD